MPSRLASKFCKYCPLSGSRLATVRIASAFTSQSIIKDYQANANIGIAKIGTLTRYTEAEQRFLCENLSTCVVHSQPEGAESFLEEQGETGSGAT